MSRSPAVEAAPGLTQLAVSRLTKAMGSAAGTACAGEVMAELGLAGIPTPAALLSFANALIHRGGVVEAVGRALKVVAHLRGARDH